MNFISSLITKHPSIDIILDSETNPSQKIKDQNGNLSEAPIYNDWEPVKGKVIVDLKRIKNFQHQGIKIEFIGIIEDQRKCLSKFISLCNDLDSSNELYNEITQYEFEFNNLEKPYDSFTGAFNRLKYYLKATIQTGYKSIDCEKEIIVQKTSHNITTNSALNIIEDNPSIQMEIGIEEWIHVSFNVFNSKFFLKGCIEGKNMMTDSDVVGKFEIMDGSPYKDEWIPIRIYLSAYKLSPTYLNVNNRFSVQYYLNLVLVDSDERKYYKQHEITLIRQ